MQAFSYEALPGRVVFGSGTSSSKVAEEVKRLGCTRAIVLTTSFQTADGDRLKQALGDLCVATYNNATMHTPMEITQEALRIVKDSGVDCTVALGGGSTIGLGKALALATDGKLKQIVIPTTYAGSEATPIIGQTVNKVKTTERTLKVLPDTIIYDVDLTYTLPDTMTVTSAMNAIAHSVEALYAPEANPIISMMAIEGIKRAAGALPVLHKNGKDKGARADMLYASWLCGHCLGSVGMGLHHKLCHTLGGTFNLSHSETHTVVLPYALAYNAPYIPEIMSSLAAELKTDNVPGALYDLSHQHGGPTNLKDLGLKEEDIETAINLAVAKPYPNPAPLDRERISKLLTQAYNGRRPEPEL